jgi:outer membrane protein OmpA-like peptidoglycan-associated protein
MKFVVPLSLVVAWLVALPASAETPPAAPGSGSAQGEARAAVTSPDGPEIATDQASRRASLGIHNSLAASSGLLRLSAASSGAPGTFRISLLGNFYAGSGFLCSGTPSGGCSHVATQPHKDDARRLGANLGFSVTPWQFLEGYLGFRSRSSHNDQSRPQLLQALGDANLGAKAFAPAWGVLSFGGQADLWLLSDAGNVGVTSAATSYALKGLASMDLTRPGQGTSPLPLRAHLNVGWYFDNSSALVTHSERASGQVINRVERFGLGVNRLDALELGLGVEGVWEVVRPFLEWSIDVPEARQHYTCVRNTLEPGDKCLKSGRSFAATPSRLGLGARFFPGPAGVAVTGALEIGTGATATFLQEVVPELPWSLYLGVGYAADTRPSKPAVVREVKVERVAETKQPVHHYVAGRVLDGATGNPVPRAVLEYDGRELTGMVASESGSFKTLDLEPGEYKFKVKADGYREGECRTTLPADASPAAGDKTPSAGEPVVGADGSITVSIDCSLEALPMVGTVTGVVVDATSGVPVSAAHIRIKDNLGRELNLTASASGSFRFEEVLAGTVKLVLDAPDYLLGSAELEVKAREDLSTRVVMYHRPKKATVTVGTKELKLERQLQFRPDSAQLVPESVAIVQEVAEILRKRAELREIEIQGYTDNAGPAVDNRRLSQQRAEAVRDALVDLGVEAGRLTANGYGPDKPLVPNTSEANRAKNRRVVFVVVPAAR